MSAPEGNLPRKGYPWRYNTSDGPSDDPGTQAPHKPMTTEALKDRIGQFADSGMKHTGWSGEAAKGEDV